MKINELSAPKGTRRKAKRKGRGQRSGLGKTSGRGHKGAGQRSGGGKRFDYEGGQMPLFRRLPKRGFRGNFSQEYQVVNVGRLEVFEAGEEVGPEQLYKRKVVRKKSLPVKILCKGELKKGLKVKAHAFSAKAKEIIEKAGGTASVIGKEE